MPTELTTKNVKPTDFDLDVINFRKKNPLDDVNMSIVAGNIVMTCQRLGGWAFTWQDYVNTRANGLLGLERDIIDGFARDRLLIYRNGVYRAQNAFVQACAKLIVAA